MIAPPGAGRQRFAPSRSESIRRVSRRTERGKGADEDFKFESVERPWRTRVPVVASWTRVRVAGLPSAWLTYAARDEHDEEGAHDGEDGGGDGCEDLLEGLEPAEYADGLHAGEGCAAGCGRRKSSEKKSVHA